MFPQNRRPPRAWWAGEETVAWREDRWWDQGRRNIPPPQDLPDPVSGEMGDPPSFSYRLLSYQPQKSYVLIAPEFFSRKINLSQNTQESGCNMECPRRVFIYSCGKLHKRLSSWSAHTPNPHVGPGSRRDGARRQRGRFPFVRTDVLAPSERFVFLLA